MTIHDLIFFRYPQFFPWIDRQVYYLKYKKSCEMADIIVAICQQTKNDLMEFLGVSEEKIKVIYQACHPRFYPEADSSLVKKYNNGRPYLLYTGALVKHKNIMGLLKAFSLLKNRKEIDLLIAGKGSGAYEKEVREFVKSCGLEKQIEFLGYVPDEELPGLYQQAQIFVFPSFFEGFGLPIVEAMMKGTPVITSTGSCFLETAGPSSSYVNPEDPAALAHEIDSLLASLLSSHEKRIEIGQKAKEWARQFHIQKASDHLNELYHSLL